MFKERLIKKYANRRLYDATESRHVTLDDIRKLIAGGEKVKVVDDKSGEDLTRSVLLQIIADQEQFGTPLLSTDLLESIIRFYGNPVQTMFTRLMEQSIGTFARQQQAMQAEVAKSFAEPITPFADFTRQNLEQWSKLQASMMSAFVPAKPETSTRPGNEPETPRPDEPRGGRQ